jgi:hypothetical protein
MSSRTTIKCGVCLDECGEKNIAITECGHITHLKCFTRVLSTSDNCIYCRKKLNLKEEKEEDDDDTQPFGMWIDNRQPYTLRKMGENMLILVVSLLYAYLIMMCFKIVKIEMNWV